MSLPALTRSWEPSLTFFVRLRDAEDAAAVSRMAESGANNLIPLTATGELNWQGPAVIGADGLEDGDVLAVEPGGAAHVLMRHADQHHSVFLTNRCNSYCLMCSQPPTPQDDSWLVDEALQVARHIDGRPQQIGFTGGEPLLLGTRLREVLEAYAVALPATRFDVLTNGRLFSNDALARQLLDNLRVPVTWLVPLYGHADFLHDYVVQSPGAFDETPERVNDFATPDGINFVCG